MYDRGLNIILSEKEGERGRRGNKDFTEEVTFECGRMSSFCQFARVELLCPFSGFQHNREDSFYSKSVESVGK